MYYWHEPLPNNYFHDLLQVPSLNTLLSEIKVASSYVTVARWNCITIRSFRLSPRNISILLSNINLDIACIPYVNAHAKVQ